MTPSRALLVVLVLGSCASRQQQFTTLPVVQSSPRVETMVVEKTVEKPVHCVTAGQIPPEPAPLGKKLTGIVRYDIGPLEKSARELRAALRRARELLLKCVGG